MCLCPYGALDGIEAVIPDEILAVNSGLTLYMFLERFTIPVRGNREAEEIAEGGSQVNVVK